MNQTFRHIRGVIDVIKKWISFVTYWVSLVTYIGLGLFALVVAFYTVGLAVKRELPQAVSYEIFFLSLAIFLLSFLTYRLFPERFIEWDPRELSLYLPPFSNLLMSVSLSYFIISLLNQRAAFFWEKLLSLAEAEPLIYIIIGSLSFVIPIFVIFFIITVFLPFWFAKNFAKGILSKTLLAAGFIVPLVLILWFSYSGLLDKAVNSQFFSDLSVQIGKFILGFIPVGWFYELFIGSIAAEKRKRTRAVFF